MTVQKAIEALRENAEYLSYDVPTRISEQSSEDTIANTALRSMITVAAW
jgi:hypothetical protein